MLDALMLAAREITQPTLRHTVLRSVAIAALVFLAIWGAAGWALVDAHLFANRWLESALELLGSLAALVLTWVLFPAIVTAIAGLFLDRVLDDIERRHYPELPSARPQSWSEILIATLRLTLAAIVLNLLALPLYVFVPGVNLVLFYGLNGYLLGREYFELVALRHLPMREARALRRSVSLRVLLAGAVIAFLFSVPILNLAAPVLGAAFMLHVFMQLARDRRFGIR